MKKLGFTLLLACSLIALPSCNNKGGNTQEDEKKESKKGKTEHKGHTCVDLGLPSGTLWATCNVGADQPSDYGNYYAWGETYTKAEYNKNNCKTLGKEMGDISGNPAYDVARKEWGGQWRMPTKAELEELNNEEYCTWEWTTQNNVNGYKVTSKKNQNSIFLPAAGGYGGPSLNCVSEVGGYWSSTSDGEDPYIAYFLYFHEDECNVDWISRPRGRTVRPVVNL